MSRWGPAALWALFTVVAVAGGLVAVALIGQSVSSATVPVLSAAEVKQSLTAAPVPTSSGTARTDKPSSSPKVTTSEKATTSDRPTPTASPTKTQSSKPSPKPPAAVVRTLSTRGGSVVAECVAGSVYLKSWSPANGFRVDEVSRGPASEVEIKFQSATSEVKLKVECRSGVPVGEQETSTDDSGESDDSDDD